MKMMTMKIYHDEKTWREKTWREKTWRKKTWSKKDQKEKNEDERGLVPFKLPTLKRDEMRKELPGLVIIKMGYVDTVNIKRRNVSAMCVYVCWVQTSNTLYDV